MDSPQAPLIADRNRDEEELEYDVATSIRRSPAEPDKPEGKRPSTFMLLLTFAAGIGGLLFGCKDPELLLRCIYTDNSQMTQVLCLQRSSPSTPHSRTEP